MPSVPHTPEEVLAWLRRSHEVHDSLSVAEFHEIYSQDAQVKFANYPVAEGLDAIKQSFIPTFEKLAYMKHLIRQADKVDDRVWLTVDITYRAKGDPDSEDITIPAAGFATVVTEGEEAGKIKRFEVYIDSAPLLQKMEAVANLEHGK
ncbi:hypothetical protein CH063_10567 [Colletotrichum higginsianum]|uniref:SnoaL-like domain-containing protein n=2 Tax=Colletotrichum higginsianum TaxID=80884 RepID=H1VHY9_COLHI|nr:uncharacterized protein CH63R_10464 [Colletotrichum higginsianum IMI 349063]OBR06344.1 hypothetical protein CH63R_10464 [Colletotrichum higginsianum IMI 349063]TIC97894.1 hypothetical protein CH35J_007285 [Colletotrichum higginsianum]CCF39842.1 hypothetical protein CH063_10567 [Colletotrichum higginsianum]